MKRIALFLICFASLIIIGCDKKNSNSEIVDDAEQPFVMKTPNAGNLPFETLAVTQDGGQYYISALTEKKEGVSILMMTFSFDVCICSEKGSGFSVKRGPVPKTVQS